MMSSGRSLDGVRLRVQGFLDSNPHTLCCFYFRTSDGKDQWVEVESFLIDDRACGGGAECVKEGGPQ